MSDETPLPEAVSTKNDLCVKSIGNLDLLRLPVRTGMVAAFFSIFDSLTPFVWISPFCSGETSSCAGLLGMLLFC